MAKAGEYSSFQELVGFSSFFIVLFLPRKYQ